MSAPLKLAGFAACCVLVFGVAAVAGGRSAPTGPTTGHARGTRRGAWRDRHGDDAAGMRPTRSAASPSPTAACGSRWPRRRSRAARPRSLRFTIDGADGPVRDFEVEHEKRMHLIVVRRDGTGFQHLHPELAPTAPGARRSRCPTPGAYRVFADFKRGGERTRSRPT